MTLTLRTDRSLVRAAARSVRYLHMSFAAPEAQARTARMPLKVAFVLDRSGSMNGEKIRLARHAVDSAVRMLRPEDQFSIVVYDDRIDVLVEAMHATAEARRTASERLAAIDARGSTDLCTGWLRGCQQIAEHLSHDMVAKCLLLSDGLANVGTTDPDVLTERAGQLRNGCVVTTTFGVGADFDERLMASMARAGGGNFYFMEHPRQIQDMLSSELGETLETVARRPVVDVDLPEGLEAEVMHDLRWRVRGRCLRVELDDLVSGQEVSFILKLRFPLGDPGNRAQVRVTLSSEDGQVSGDAETAWTFADHAANDAQPRDRRVDRLVADIYAHRARREAVERNRAGQYGDAVAFLRAARDRILSYADDDEQLRGIAASLREEERGYGVPMSALGLKQAQWASVSAARMRTADGKARRVPK